jgi:AcrR family transcriptional regulator
MTRDGGEQDRRGVKARHGRDGSTRDEILAAAQRLLGREGYAGITARQIAAEAGTNLALVNYYFGSKQNLLLQLFDDIDRGKLARQQAMYSADAPLSAKWREAAHFYRQDLADGYVRMLQELTSLGYGNPAVAERVQARLNGWRALLEEVAAAYLPELGIDLPPGLVASAVVSFWLGMETQHLSGLDEEHGHFFEVLDFVGDWLESRERERGGVSRTVPVAAPAVPGSEAD